MISRPTAIRRPQPFSGIRPFVVLATLVLALAAVVPGSAAYGHSALVKATPAAGEKVTSVPTEVVLTFNEDVAPGLATIRVTDGEGLAMTEGEAVVSGTTVTQKLRTDLHAGSYLVAFKVTSADGHPVSDGYSFVIPTSVSSSTPTTLDPSDPVVVPPVNGSSSSSSTSATTPSAASSSPAVAPRTDAQKSSGHLALLIAMGVAVLAVLAGAGAVLAQRRRDPGTD